ncbi:MAG: ABC transporter substrate-binding protein, partial [Lachnospiraceae bacterium]|nr:ABC transporter substrate-binding protein [Lachnospiraceae bacterium]
MKKRVLAMILTTALSALTLAGCGGGGSSTTGGSFKIGAIGPMTGDGAAYGLAVVNGSKLAVDEINAAGGVNGFMLEHKGEDD